MDKTNITQDWTCPVCGKINSATTMQCTPQMFIVYMYWVVDRTKDLCVVTETREKAEEYIKSKMEGRRYNGSGIYKIGELPLYI